MIDKTIVLNGDTIHITEGRTADFEKCAVAHFTGSDGWGVTMNIRLNELDTFMGNQHMQKLFIKFAKDKLGVS